MNTTDQTLFNKKFFLFVLVLLVLVTAFIFYFSLNRVSPTSAASKTNYISQATLAERYGLRVNLLGVTAAGGMVDLRIKILDGEKAKSLLRDKKNFPSLAVGNGPTVLQVDADMQSQEIKFESDSGLFLLFPNSGNLIAPGSPVQVQFGDILLEPIVAR